MPASCKNEGWRQRRPLERRLGLKFAAAQHASCCSARTRIPVGPLGLGHAACNERPAFGRGEFLFLGLIVAVPPLLLLRRPLLFRRVPLFPGHRLGLIPARWLSLSFDP